MFSQISFCFIVLITITITIVSVSGQGRRHVFGPSVSTALTPIPKVNTNTNNIIRPRDNVRVQSQQYGTASLPRTTTQGTKIFKGEIPELCENSKAEIRVFPGDKLDQPNKSNLQKQIIQILMPEELFDFDGEEIAEQVLEAVGNFTPNFSAQVESTHQGCWAIAYASNYDKNDDFIQMVRNALIQFYNKDVIDAFDRMMSQSLELIDESFNFVAVIAAQGNNDQNAQSIQHDIQNDDRISFLGCIFEQIMQIQFGEMKGDQANLNKCISSQQQQQLQQYKNVFYGQSCGCGAVGSFPVGCDYHRGIEQKICYVQDPGNCGCAADSGFFPGQKWRYCGDSMHEMQSWLDVHDRFNGIEPVSQDGFCDGLDYRLD